jgi:hypothetical protein
MPGRPQDRRAGGLKTDRPRAGNKRDLQQLATAGQSPGLLAFDADLATGWWELAPRAELGCLARARYLEPVDDLPAWSIPCVCLSSQLWRTIGSRTGVTTIDTRFEIWL